MVQFLTLSDLSPFATIDPVKAAAMIEDATALAVMAAPCLGTSVLTANQLGSIRAILRGAVLRWNEAGTGAMQSQSAGPFGATIDTRQQRRGMFWPSEITQLQDVCGATTSSGAFAVDTVGFGYGLHLDTCSLNFGGDCSCGAALTGGYPLYGA